MEIIRIGICLKDQAFAKALARGLAKYAHFMEFTVMESSNEYMLYDMILGKNSSCFSRHDNFIRLETSRVNVADDENCKSLYEYEDCQTMINDLLLIYFRMTGNYSYIKQNRLCTTVTGISASGGAGTTSVMLSVIRILYQLYGSKSLYVSLTPLGGHYNYMECKRENNFRLLLYNLETKDDFPIDSYISHYNEMDVIDNGIINYGLSDLNSKMLNRLMTIICERGLYDYIFFDCGCYIARENREIISNSDIVLLTGKMTEKNSPLSEKLYDEFRQLTESARLIKINNFDRFCSADNGKDEFFISEDSGAFNDGRIDLQHNYGSEIEAIVKSLVEV